MTTPSIIYRSLGPANDPLWGQGKTNFITDINAVAQAIRTVLLLFQGEWWESVQSGTPWFQSILGHANSPAVTLLLVTQILTVPFTQSVESVTTAYDPASRSYTFSATVITSFGPVQVNGVPTPPQQGFPL